MESSPRPPNLAICKVCISSGSQGKRGVLQPKAAKLDTLGQDTLLKALTGPRLLLPSPDSRKKQPGIL